MEHNDIRHKLSEYIDGSITDQERTEIEAHLKTCTQCSEALSELRKTIEHIKTVEEIEPPAWMTQKIMAKVHAEAEEKKSLFQRIFYPLIVKLPIQAVAIVFLAITAFYIYRNIQPATGPSEAPSQEFAAKKQVPPADTAQDKLAKAERPAPRSKQVPQTPAYKALDMKQEYEKPPQPTLQGQATAPPPAPAVPVMPAEQPMPAKKEIDSLKPAASQAGAPTAISEQATGVAPHAEGKSKSAAPMQRALNAELADPRECQKYGMIANDEGLCVPVMKLTGDLQKIFNITDCHAISGLTCRITYNGKLPLPSEVFFIEYDKNGNIVGEKTRLIYPELKAGESGRATFRVKSTATVTIVLSGVWEGPYKNPY